MVYWVDKMKIHGFPLLLLTDVFLILPRTYTNFSSFLTYLYLVFLVTLPDSFIKPEPILN